MSNHRSQHTQNSLVGNKMITLLRNFCLSIPWLRLYLWLQTIGVVIFYLLVWRRASLSRKDSIDPQAPQASGPASNNATNHPLVSIVVPARNEERNIRRCVESLLEQDYEPFEVIAINDDSTDATGSILEDIATHHPRGQLLHILHLHELPQGWTGKTHAVHCGVQQAQGEWLLLTDADTWHSPAALRTTLTRAIEEGIDMFTMNPFQQLVGFWNKVLMPTTFLDYWAQYSARAVNDPASSVATANGQYILLRHSVYDATGGFARPGVRDAHPEDYYLALAIKSSGYRLRLVIMSKLVYTYSFSGLAEIWQSFARIPDKKQRNLAFYFTLFRWPHISFIPFLLPLLLWLTSRRKRGSKRGIHPLEAGIALGLQWTSMLTFHSWFNRLAGIPSLYAFAHPLAGCVKTISLVRAFWRGLTGKSIQWHGRDYSQQKQSEEESSKETSVPAITT